MTVNSSHLKAGWETEFYPPFWAATRGWIFPYRGCPPRSRTWSRWAFLRRLPKPLPNHRWKSRI